MPNIRRFWDRFVNNPSEIGCLQPSCACLIVGVTALLTVILVVLFLNMGSK